MNSDHFHKNRYIWIVLALVVSFSLVGIALAAASNTSKSITDVGTAPQPYQGVAQPERSSPPSPVQISSKQTESHSQPDQLSEKMRLQVIADSQASAPDAIQRVEFWNFASGFTWIWGAANPNQPITITTSSGDTLYGFSDGDGNYGTDHPTYLYAGDLITATDASGDPPVTIVFPDLQADSDSTSDLVTGHIGYSNWEVEIHPDWNEPMTTTLTDGEGNFSKSFLDIPPNGRGYIRFVETIQPNDVEAIFHRPFYDLQPTIQANYAHEWVEGQYDPGYQVWITLTNNLGEIKATAHGVTAEIPWWNGDSGISTNYNVPWDARPPDVEVGDFVYLKMDNGRIDDLQLGKIDGELNIDADIFTGTLDVPWLTDPVNGDCGVWVDGGPGTSFEGVDPHGGTFTCDFAALGWDLIPGQDVGVGYYEPDADKVLNVFHEPTPHLWINLETMGPPAFGNNYAIRVHYNNDGELTAPDVTITQAFWGAIYLSDTSGFAHTGTGDPLDPIVWQVGDLSVDRMSERSFFIFLQVVNPPGAAVFTAADIATSLEYFQGDEWSKHAEWAADVVENNSDLGINKWAWTGNPVPGQEFVYAVNVCENGGTPSSEVYITDTLPLSTTLLNWWGQFPGWEEVTASDHLLVVKRPTDITPGNNCGEVYLNVLLSDLAWPGMPLHNEAMTWSNSDLNPDNNIAYMDHNASGPSYNLHLNRQWPFGMFVPGGEISYEFNYTNWGNMPMPGTVLTATIPVGTEFLYAYTWDWYGWLQVTPTIVTGEYVVFDFGTYPNGYNANLGLRLKIADDTLPETPLVVNINIMGDMLEERYDDNTLVFTEAVNPGGPNLRVDKHTSWGWNIWDDGVPHQQLWYEMRVFNLGTQSLTNLVITDTYPVSTTVNWCGWNWGAGGSQGCTVDALNHQVVYTATYMDPGWNAATSLRLDVAEQDIGVQGLTFINQVNAPVEGDVAPDDNSDTVISLTGPDAFVRKWLKAGELRAGELITYTVEFGNHNRWPWNGDQNFGSHITDTLPTGMTFVKAIPYWDPTNTWTPVITDGQQIVWESWTMWAESTWNFDLVAQIDSDVDLGQELVNEIEIWGDSPADIDPIPANNRFEYPLKLLIYRMLMPLTQRTP